MPRQKHRFGCRHTKKRERAVTSAKRHVVNSPCFFFFSLIFQLRKSRLEFVMQFNYFNDIRFPNHWAIIKYFNWSLDFFFLFCFLVRWLNYKFVDLFSVYLLILLLLFYFILIREVLRSNYLWTLEFTSLICVFRPLYRCVV